MNSKTKQILGAIIFVLVFWGLCIVFAGGLFTADFVEIDILPESVLPLCQAVFPYIFIAAMIISIVVSAVLKKTAFAVTTAITVAVPFAAMGIATLLMKIFSEGTPAVVPFIFVAAPASSFLYMFS